MAFVEAVLPVSYTVRSQKVISVAYVGIESRVTDTRHRLHKL
jgi:hypothetical protein